MSDPVSGSRAKRKREKKRMDTGDPRRRGPATAMRTVAVALLIAMLVLFATLRADAACCHCFGCGFQGCFNAMNECAACAGDCSGNGCTASTCDSSATDCSALDTCAAGTTIFFDMNPPPTPTQTPTNTPTQTPTNTPTATPTRTPALPVPVLGPPGSWNFAGLAVALLLLGLLLLTRVRVSTSSSS